VCYKETKNKNKLAFSKRRKQLGEEKLIPDLIELVPWQMGEIKN